MATEIRVPALGESVTEATVGQWFKAVGDSVAADEPLVELETEKITMEVPAPAAGVIAAIEAKGGATVAIGALLGTIITDKAAIAANAKKAKPSVTGRPGEKTETTRPIGAGPEEMKERGPAEPARAGELVSPAARKIMAEKKAALAVVEGTGKEGRITKADALAAVEKAAQPIAARAPPAPEEQARETRVPMTRLRQTIARRLKEAQNTAAMLTTFNEVDMSAVLALRSQYRDLFERKHAVRLGIMGFFVKACVQALKEIPAVNGEIDGTDLVYKDYYHIGVAVGTERGLVVPVVRDADLKSLAEIERTIAELASRARNGALKLEEMQGGTFTITNGGIYGSLMSTPILNAPQSGILGMHKIQERPMVVDGEIKARPMMYLAFSYDHRIVDGREAVTFLVRVKESLEDPQRLVLDL
jgi:2-oxoglutarate dehydrogenase E2 component (dihydrolipoamide succinyltransferase)